MALTDDEAARGVIAASTGNHGLGLAWSGTQRGVSVTICVPRGNNPEKSAAIRGLGATLIEVGDRYDDTIAACRALADRDGKTLVHSTNHHQVISGAATMTAEFWSRHRRSMRSSSRWAVVHRPSARRLCAMC